MAVLFREADTHKRSLHRRRAESRESAESAAITRNLHADVEDRSDIYDRARVIYNRGRRHRLSRPAGIL